MLKDYGEISDLKLIYRGSVDGFKAATFHEKCDIKGPTLSILRTTDGYRFGGFTTLDWNQSDKY